MKELFFPQHCAFCGKVIDSSALICPDCWRSLPRTEQAYMRGNITEDKFVQVKQFARGAAFLFYEHGSSFQNAIYEFKYGRFANPHIGYALAKEAAYEFMQTDFFDGIDLILPIPLHAKRLNERGFNQAEWIAKGLSDATGIPMDSTYLTRVVNNEHQAREHGRDRKKNVHGIFAVNHPEELYRKHLLLVDDVITTGSTLLSCMDALQCVRGRTVSVFALGKSR